MKKTDSPANSATTRRQFLHRIGEAGGVAAVYQAMISMGLLVPGDARAADNQTRWREQSRHGVNASLPTVAVLGAGIAGLSAAYELKKAGYPCYVIEARNRAGGRNHTLRAGDVLTETDSSQLCEFDSDPELYFNAGPARISQHHKNLLAYCRELNVPLQAFINDNRGAYVHSRSAFGGQPVRARELVTAMRGTIAELLAKAINAGALDTDISFAERAQVLSVLRDYGALSAFHRFEGSTRAGLQPGTGGLRPAQAANPLAYEDIFLHPDIPYVPSFVETYNQAATMMQPVGGMDRIATAFAEQLQEEIFYGVEITAIRRAGQRVRLEGRAGEEEGAIEVDYAIITIPPTVLRSIDNDFSAPVRTAISQVQVATPTKIAFQSPRFWESEDDIYGGISWTDPEILQIWYPSSGFGNAQGILVGSYLFGGSDAQTFAALSPAQRIERALVYGEQLHPQYRSNLSRGLSVAWQKVPYSAGGWAVSNPAPVLQQADGPFLFAGDHLSYLPGWQEGAVISSMQALANLADMTGV
jgi:monoamine oxidase